MCYWLSVFRDELVEFSRGREGKLVWEYVKQVNYLSVLFLLPLLLSVFFSYSCCRRLEEHEKRTPFSLSDC